VENPRWLPPQDKFNIESYEKIFRNYSDLKQLNHVKANWALVVLYNMCGFFVIPGNSKIQHGCHYKA
jgi:hypothetical protein